jgi:hypothetical protein
MGQQEQFVGDGEADASPPEIDAQYSVHGRGELLQLGRKFTDQIFDLFSLMTVTNQ